MYQGQLLAIYITDRKGAKLKRVEQVEAVPGQGLRGDRYFLEEGTLSSRGSPDQEVTLVEIESLEALSRDHGISLEPAQARRNLVTRGVPLNHLVGQEFAIGEVLLRGLRLCEPCNHLESLTLPGVKKALCHRGGLRAQVVRGGIVRTGDIIASQGRKGSEVHQ
jgi:MOSC domain-containing protein YiiM